MLNVKNANKKPTEEREVKTKLLMLVWVVLMAMPVHAASVRTIAGIELGSDVSNYEHLLQMERATEPPDIMFMKEVKFKPYFRNGLRGGSLLYATCGDEEKVARAKLKFADRSEKLFNELNKLYVQKFGKANQWQGNAFHTVKAWQWLLHEGQDSVEVILMYSKLDDLRPGVSIKVTLNNLWEKERACWEAKTGEHATSYERHDSSDVDLNDFVLH
jgi:hypothetical protein